MHLLPEHSLTTLDTVHCMDALCFLNGLPDDFVDMGLMSPPYDNLRTYNGFTWDFEGIAQQVYRVIKPGGVLVWVVGDATINGSETLTSFKQALYFKEQCGFKMHDTMIYEKNSTSAGPDPSRYLAMFEYMFVLSKESPKTINRILEPCIWAGASVWGKSDKRANTDIYIVSEEKPLSNIWRFNTGKGFSSNDTTEHPAIFPEALAERHILTWSNPGDIVLDCFMGSGTTAKMARNLGRHYIGCDISPEYVALARQRLQNTDPYQAIEYADGHKQMSLFEKLPL